MKQNWRFSRLNRTKEGVTPGYGASYNLSMTTARYFIAFILVLGSCMTAAPEVTSATEQDVTYCDIWPYADCEVYNDLCFIDCAPDPGYCKISANSDPSDPHALGSCVYGYAPVIADPGTAFSVGALSE